MKETQAKLGVQQILRKYDVYINSNVKPDDLKDSKDSKDSSDPNKEESNKRVWGKDLVGKEAQNRLSQWLFQIVLDAKREFRKTELSKKTVLKWHKKNWKVRVLKRHKKNSVTESF